jgi:AcrR family transcriptional regulator
MVARAPKAAVTPAAAAAPTPRREQKLRTRQQLMDAALRLADQGRGFASLSLREVSREAGVVPAAFYRHFESLDQLGLSLVEECGVTLRRLLREARRQGLDPAHVLRSSVEIYKTHVSEHRLHYQFAAGARGGAPEIRRALRTEESHFANEMAQDLRELGLFQDLSSDTLKLVSSLVVTTMMNAATDILDLPEAANQQEKELIEHFVSQLRLIFLGARQWQIKS